MTKKTTKVIKINIWNFIEMDDLNDWLDEEIEADKKLKGKGTATEIDYTIDNIKKNGDLTFTAKFFQEDEG